MITHGWKEVCNGSHGFRIRFQIPNKKKSLLATKPTLLLHCAVVHSVEQRKKK